MPRSSKAVNTQIIVNEMPTNLTVKVRAVVHSRIGTGEEILNPACGGSSISSQGNFGICRLHPSLPDQFGGVLTGFAFRCGGRPWFPIFVFSFCDLWRFGFRSRLIIECD